MKNANAKVDMTGWERTTSFDLAAVLREVLHAAGHNQRAVEFSNKAHENRLSYDQILDMCEEDGFIEITNRPRRIKMKKAWKDMTYQEMHREEVVIKIHEAIKFLDASATILKELDGGKHRIEAKHLRWLADDAAKCAYNVED